VTSSSFSFFPFTYNARDTRAILELQESEQYLENVTQGYEQNYKSMLAGPAARELGVFLVN
jgi:hypothetical protein